MSFSIVLQRNNSPTNKVEKDVVTVATATGVLRSNTSVTSPVVEIRSQLSASMLTGVNYAYISEFGRYYFVTDIVLSEHQLWIVHMQVDVLMSFKTQIKEQKGIIARQENVFNMMLDDGWFMSYQNPLVQLRTFSVATPFNAQEYILVLAGNTGTVQT